MQHFERRGGSIGHAAMILAAGARNREAEAGPDTGAARKDRVMDGSRQARRALGPGSPAEGLRQCPLDALGSIHGRLPRTVFRFHYTRNRNEL